MKLVTSNFGAVAIRIVNDEVAPPNGFVAQDIVNFIAERYAFSMRPPVMAPLQNLQTITFQGGTFAVEQERVAVIGMALVTNGDIVHAPTTDIAEKILEDLIANLEKVFGFRYSNSKQERVYQSNITVDFKDGLQDKLEGIKKLQSIINREIPRPNLPFEIKRLAFGGADISNPQLLQLQPTIEALERSDFLLERRAGTPYETNRYFSVAPLKTADHIKLLELIERDLG
jgi:hypothetical protein